MRQGAMVKALRMALLLCCLSVAPAVASAAQSVEARLQRLEDVEDIRLLLERYVELNEARDYAGYTQLFARDGELVLRVGRARGPAQILELLQKNFGGANAARGPRPGSSHLITNLRIEVRGDTATAFSRWTLLSPLENGRQEVAGKGHYQDRLVREDGRWKFSERTIATDRRDAPASQACDRECLRSMVTSYLHALLSRDAGRLPLSDALRVTEDSVAKPLAQVGLLRSVTRLRGYRQDFIDERTGVAGAHVLVEENGAPVLLVVRLKVAAGRITEIETVATRSRTEGAIFNIDGVERPNATMATVPRPEQLMTREEAVRIALLYPAGLAAGSFVKVGAPFTAEAYRLENGNVMAGPDCRLNEGCRDIGTQPVANPLRGHIDTRVVAVDERLGIVWLRMEWGTRGQKKLAVWEAFKILDGRIHAVEAFMKVIPPELGSGWTALPTG